MLDQEIAPISSATGSFVALQSPAKAIAPTGNSQLAAGNSPPVEKKAGPSAEDLARTLHIARQSIGRDLRFEVDMESGQSVIQVLDRDTGELIRQIPPEKANIYLSSNGTMQLRLLDALV